MNIRGDRSVKGLRLLKPAIIPGVIVYLCLQMLINQGYRLDINHSRNGYLERQNFQGKTMAVSFVTKPFNDSIPDDIFFKLTRASVTKKSLRSTCTTNVRLLRGFQRDIKGFLTLGLSTVPREGVFYLPKTLESLISKMTDAEKTETVIVIFIGSHNGTFVNKTLSMIDEKFATSVSAGLIQIIQPEPHIYPDFKTITKRNYNDPPGRVHWRTKQNIDFAYLFAYCENLSDYYLHLEDDVIAATGYIQEIRTYLTKIEKSKQTWLFLEYSTLGFIGKLFRSTDMCTMKEYFLLFKDDKPCDLLINDLKSIKTQIKVFKSPRSLFQHIGVASSLKGKIQNLTDKNFKDSPKKQLVKVKGSGELLNGFKSNKLPNPRAKVLTSMEAYGPFTSVRPYAVQLGGFFWAIRPNTSDFYRMIFDLPINLTLVHIKTGHPKKNNTDKLENAVVKAGHQTNGSKCEDVQILGQFDKGEFLTKLDNPLLSVSCLEILVTKPQKSWMILYEIIIKTTGTEKGNEQNAADGNSKQKR